MKKENTAEEYETRGRAAESIRLLNRRRPCGAEKNARQLEVAGFVCKAPWRGCDQPPPAVSPHRRPQFSTAGRTEPHCSLAAAIVRGWKPHRTPGNWKLRASLAKPLAGAALNRPWRFRK